MVASIFSMYCVLTTFLLDPFVFLTGHSNWISHLVILVGSFVLTLVLLKLVATSFLVWTKQLFIILSIFLIPIICGSIVLFLYSSEQTEVFLYFSSFLVLTILPISSYILWLIYSDLQARVIISTEQKESIDQSLVKVFSITNDRNQVILEIPIDQIIGFEANDNYVITHHLLDDEKLDKTMHRISMKKITELLSQIDIEFLRVHKSFLVNPNFIQKLKGKSQAYRIEMSHLPMEVPVSRSFDIQRIKK